MIDKRDLEAFANKMVRKDLILPLLPRDSPLPWFVRELDSHLAEYHRQKKLLIPNFSDAKTLAVFSDYGGENPGSAQETYSFLTCEYDSFQMFAQEMGKIRAKHKLDSPYKEIAFKDLGYGPIARALPEILNAANNLINGLLFTLIVDRRTKTLMGPDTKETHEAIQALFVEKGIDLWKPKVREKNLRILHTIAYLLKLISLRGQDLFWMTDDDAIVGNQEQLTTTSQLLQSLLDAYLGTGYFQKVGYAVPFKTGETAEFGSFLSLADLIAGAIADYFAQTAKSGQPSVSTTEADRVLTWVALHGLLLKKLVFRIEQIAKDQFNLSVLEFILKQTPPEEWKVEIKL